MEQIETKYEELLTQYGNSEDRELRVAAKLLLVALDRFRRHGGSEWSRLVQEYINIATYDTGKFERILQANRSSNPVDLNFTPGTY